MRLPENEVTLSAFTVPSELNGHYNYAWTLLSQPKDHTGIMTDQNQMTVKLSNLAEGLYKFKVTVSGLNSYGEAYANVTVLPREFYFSKYYKPVSILSHNESRVNTEFHT